MTLLATAATMFMACEKDDPTYSVQVTAAQGGTIEGQSGEYKEGETVVFKAIPADGYCFSQWSDGNIDNPRTIKVGKDDIYLTAEFAEPTIATVDLGLPSGNLWATCNVGAINPWNYGDYYAWGETLTKDKYNWKTYIYCVYGYPLKFTKYNDNVRYGTVDSKTTLESADDVATAAFGAEYSMPTLADWEELAEKCCWVWTSDYNNHGVGGYMVFLPKTDTDKGAKFYEGDTPSAYSLSDAHIFLPAAGLRYSASLNGAGCGYYWSSSLYESDPYGARFCGFDGVSVGPSGDCGRYFGFSVRPVRRP